jgi:hypothetical protein
VRRRPRKSREIVAIWLGVVALVLHALIPLAQGIPGPHRAPGQPSGLVLCIAFAAKAGPAEDGRTPTENDRRSCPVCQINALGKSLLPAMVVASPPPPDWSAEWRECVAEYAGGPFPRSWRARAPPNIA